MVNSATQITAVVAAGTSGSVKVINADGTATKSGFTFLHIPTITSFTPTSAGKDSTVIITGTNFTGVSGASSVSFGGTNAASYVVNSATQITAVVAAGTSGNVKVINTDGTATKSGFTFLNIPTITSFTPTSAGKDSTVVITGTNFTGVSGASSVSFGGTNATSYVVNSATQITAVVASGTSGSVKVINTDGTATKSGFTFLNIPTITSFTPTSAAKDSTVIIIGTNFTGVSGASSVSFGGTNATSYVVNSATQITAVVAAGTSGSVMVINTDGTATKSGFTFLNIPTITSFTPTSAGLDSTVIITGTNFTGVSGASSVTFGGTNAASYTVNSNTQITAVVAAGTSGSVEVINTGVTATKSGFTFLNIPTIASFTPTSAGIDSTVIITGTNFTGVAGVSSVTFGGTNAASYTVNSDTQITAVVAAGTSGSVEVINTDGTAIKAGFTFIPSPTISLISPAIAGTGTSITITGTNYTGTGVIVNSVYIGGVAATVTGTTSTTITATVGASATGTDVTVNTTGGSATLASSFTYLYPPTINSISPTSAGTGTSITITGTRFTGTGVTVNSVYIGGVAATVTAITSTTITATVGVSASGTDVTVNTTGGSVTLSSSFTYIPVASITSFSPTTAGTGITVTIVGVDYKVGGISVVSDVQFGGTSASSFTVVSTDTITAIVAAGTTGNVSVITSAGTASLAGFTFELPPTISTISSLTAYQGDNITITGTNFSDATVVTFGTTSDYSFTISSSTSLNVTVPSGVVGAVGLTVSNPGGASSPTSITINNKWTGASSSDWNDAGSWSAGSVPNTELVNIPSGLVTYPVLSSSPVINDLILNGNISLNGNWLYIESTLTGTGTFIGSPSSNLQMDGSGTVYFDPSNNSLSNLVINNTVTLGNALDLYGILYSNTGSTLTTGGYLTLKCTGTTQNAMVNAVSGTISGTVTTERYIPGHSFRPFMDICPMVSNAGSVFNNWQEGGNDSNGYGVQITGVKDTVATSNWVSTKGFDVSYSGNGSMQTFPGGVWTYPTNTKTMNLDPAMGYRLLMRGNRSFNLYSTPQPTAMNSDVTLRTKGDLVIGDVTFSTSGTNSTGGFSSSYGLNSGASSFSFIGNPFASTVSWGNICGHSGSTQGIQPYYYYLDPNVVDGSNASTYINYNSVSGTNSSGGTSNIGDDIQPGMAFFVQQDGTGTSPQILIQEADKTAGNAPLTVFGVKTPVNKLAINLRKGGRSIDGAVAVFKNGFTKAIGREDSRKLMNTGESLTFSENGIQLCIDAMGLPTISDTFQLHLYKMVKNTAYQLKLNAAVFNSNGMNAFLNDKYSKTVTQLASDSTIIKFTATADSATYFNRFSISFAPNTLPISTITLTATESNDKRVSLNWNTTSINNIAFFIIQRSVNGRDFINLATVSSSINTYTDSANLVGQVYYRIKAISNNDAASFSDAVAINITNANNNLVAYPNPIIGSSFNIQLNNADAGKYTLELYNSLGQKVVSQELTHSGGRLFKNISTDKLISSGIYTLKLIGSNGGNYQSMVSFK